MEFGDELTLNSFTVPWLIWIQLVVMFLLIILLLFGVTLLTSDAAAPPSPSFFSAPAASSGSLISIVQDEDVSGEGDGEIGDCLVIQEDKDGDESSSPSKDPVVLQFLRGQIHPCSYMKSIFKCFGFDSSSKTSKPPDKRG